MLSTRMQKAFQNGCGRFLVSFGIQWALVVSALCLGCAKDKASEKPPHFEIASEIPVGKTIVEVLEIRYSPRVEEISQKMSSALAANRCWWFDYLRAHIDDRPLPYHTNFGISQVEYTEYLDGADKSRHLRKVSDATLIFIRHGDVLSVDIGDPDSPIEKWRLNLSTRKLVTPTGTVDKPTWEASDDSTQPLGAYEGYSWQYEKADAKLTSVQTVTLWIYRLKATGLMFWRMEDSEVRDTQMVRTINLTFRYDPKQGSTTDPTGPRQRKCAAIAQ